MVARRKSFIGLRKRLLELPRRKKRALLVVLDFVGLSAILWLGMSIRYGTSYWPDDWTAVLLFSAPVIAIVTLASAELYRFVTRYLGSHGHGRIIGAFLMSVLIWALLVFMMGQNGIPRSVILLYGIAGSALLILSRQCIAWLLSNYGIVLPKFDMSKGREPVLIYGAGRLGVELSRTLARSSEYDVVGFCDPSPSLWGQYVADIRVYQPDRLAPVVERFGVTQVLLALPENERRERRAVLKDLEQLPVEVKILPSLEDIASGRVDVSRLRRLDVADLLGRDSVPPLDDLLSRNTRQKNVLVTGAGGSVGSELVRTVFKQGPSRLVLLDISEAALYNIEIELRDAIAKDAASGKQMPDVVGVLGSVLDEALLLDTLRRYDIHTIYHAAAYKHVPLVEHNSIVGIENNSFGTDIVAEAAIECGVERMVLISTDKAVRPTNVMGASKRLAELALQARAMTDPVTTFAIVRFGNVLDSSGSVVGRFRRQIANGGPVTVTHPEVVRYFMSIPEAAELVIQAGAMAKGGGIFALEMGELVKIDDLARLMIRLSGLEVKDAANPEGDIEISYIGLRPGEKLYEELLIGADTTPTEHPRILRLDEPALTPQELAHEFDQLRAAIALRDTAGIQGVLMRIVEGYQMDASSDLAEQISLATHVAPSRTLH